MNAADEHIQALEQAVDALDLLRRAAEYFPGKVVFSTSLGEEDQVLTDLIFRYRLPIDIFSLDTGRLFPETLELIQRTEEKYGQKIRICYPDGIATETFVNTHGINAFYQSVELRKACCAVRKVQPLRRALAGASVWITGLRASQSENRQTMKRVEFDPGFGLLKCNPLLDWEFDDVKKHIAEHDVPYNPLHDRGFLSIGCAPCTRAVAPGEDLRAGRWWWESSKKECGLHENYFNKTSNTQTT